MARHQVLIFLVIGFLNHAANARPQGPDAQAINSMVLKMIADNAPPSCGAAPVPAPTCSGPPPPQVIMNPGQVVDYMMNELNNGRPAQVPPVIIIPQPPPMIPPPGILPPYIPPPSYVPLPPYVPPYLAPPPIFPPLVGPPAILPPPAEPPATTAAPEPVDPPIFLGPPLTAPVDPVTEAPPVVPDNSPPQPIPDPPVEEATSPPMPIDCPAPSS